MTAGVEVTGPQLSPLEIAVLESVCENPTGLWEWNGSFSHHASHLRQRNIEVLWRSGVRSCLSKGLVGLFHCAGKCAAQTTPVPEHEVKKVLSNPVSWSPPQTEEVGRIVLNLTMKGVDVLEWLDEHESSGG